MFLRPFIALVLLIAFIIFMVAKSKRDARGLSIDLDRKVEEKETSGSLETKPQPEKENTPKEEKAPKVEDKPIIVVQKDDPFAHLAKASPMTQEDEEKIQNLPEDLRSSIEKYPETKDEILKYFTWKSDPKNYDLSGKYKKGDLPKFIQWDSRWAFEPIGDSFMGHAACGPVNLSSIYIHFTGDTRMNPVAMSRWAEDHGYYINGFGTSGYIFEEGAEKLGLKSHVGEFEMDYIKEALDNGDILVLHVTKGDFTTSGHYIMITGYDENDKLIVHDVNSPNNSRKKWDYDRLKDQVNVVWCINE